MRLHRLFFFFLLYLIPVQLGYHFWPKFSYIYGLRIDYLSPTIYLTDILVFFILGLWLAERFNFFLKSESSKFNFSVKNLRLFLFFVFLAVNCLLAQNQGAAIYKLVKIVELFLLGFYISKNNYSLDAIRCPLSWTVIYSSLIAVAQFIKQSSLGGVFYWLGERNFNFGTLGIAKGNFLGHFLLRPYATFSHPNALAGFILAAFILSTPFVYKKNKLFFFFYFLLFSFTLFLSFSRSSWLAGLLIILLLTARLKRLRIMFFGLTIFLLIVLLANSPIFSEESFSQRIELNKISLHLIKQNPIIGVGLNNFVVHLPKFQQGKILWLQPVHNIYLLIASETGLMGLLIFLWFLISTFKKLTAHLLAGKVDGYQLAIALIAILFTGFFDHYWLTLQQNQMLFALVLGLIWEVKKNKNS